MMVMDDGVCRTEVTVVGTRLLFQNAHRVDKLMGPPGMETVIYWAWADLDCLIMHLLSPAPTLPVLKPKTPISTQKTDLGVMRMPSSTVQLNVPHQLCSLSLSFTQKEEENSCTCYP